MKFRVLSFSIIFSLLSSIYGHGQNIALRKPYTYSTVPNYSDTNPDSQHTLLTDGVYTEGRFWIQNTTVGWFNADVVKITIDLQREETIGAITFNTAGGNAGAYFPKNLFVFISSDNINFNYVGDAADISKEYDEGYRLIKFKLEDINRKGRYVLIAGIPDGIFLFVDEVEIIKGNGSTKRSKIRQKVAVNCIDDFIAMVKTNDHRTKVLNKQVDALPKEIGSAIRKSDWYGNRDKLKKPDRYEKKIGEFIGNQLSMKYNQGFVLKRQSPWDNYSPILVPSGGEGNLKFNFSISKGEEVYGALSITNCTLKKQSIELGYVLQNDIKVELYQASFVGTRKHIMAADPLIPIQTGIEIKPGFTEYILFKAKKDREGTGSTVISITNGKEISTIEVMLDVTAKIKYPENIGLNTNVFAELDKAVINDRVQYAALDLMEHKINTVEVLPSYIPYNFKTRDFSITTNYIKKFKGVKNILLFVNYESEVRRLGGLEKGKYLSEEWKGGFITWYTNISKSMINAGYSDVNIYLFPYDEPRSQESIKDFIELIKWVNISMPEIKVYTTLQNKDAIDKLLPLVDVAQVYCDNLKELPKSKADIWTYFMSDDRAAHPYENYRLLAWDAFIKDYKGLGFWNYADNGKGKLETNSIDDALIIPERNFSVIYSGPGKSIITTRRWEAFKVGFDDYEILSFYASLFGDSIAKTKARGVLSHPENINLADLVRTQMLAEILIKLNQ